MLDSAQILHLHALRVSRINEQSEGTHSLSNHYRALPAAIQLVVLVPGGSLIDGGTAVHECLDAIRPALSSRMQNFWKAAYLSDLDAVLISAKAYACHRLTYHTRFKGSIPDGHESEQKRSTNLY